MQALCMRGSGICRPGLTPQGLHEHLMHAVKAHGASGAGKYSAVYYGMCG